MIALLVGMLGTPSNRALAEPLPGMEDVSYNGTAEGPFSGLDGPTNTLLIDEYGELSQDLGSVLSGTVAIEAWSNGNDRDGRTYTFRLTAVDLAGNQGSVDAIVTVVK